MSIAARQHNARVRHKNWWHRYFWSQDEHWAKFAVYKAAYRAQAAKCKGNGKYNFWGQVSLRAAAYCEKMFGPVPELLLRRPIPRKYRALHSADVGTWLRVPSPYYRRKKRS